MKNLLLLIILLPILSFGQGGNYTFTTLRATSKITSPIYFKGTDTLISKLDTANHWRAGSLSRYQYRYIHSITSPWTISGTDIYYNLGNVRTTKKLKGSNIETNDTTFTTRLGIESGTHEVETTQRYNTMIGHQSGHATTTGKFNTFIGDASGYANTTGGKNTFLGYSAGSANVSGSNNVFLGIYSGQYTKQSNKLIIDAIDRNDTTDIENISLITGTFDAVAANQRLRFNGIPYIMGSLSDSIAASRGYAKAHGSSVTPQNVTAGSNKISLGGTPTGAGLQAFSIDVTEANVNHNSLLNYSVGKHFYQKNIDTVKTSITGLLKATSGLLSQASAGTDYQAALTNPVTGTGTLNYIPKITANPTGSTIGNSDIVSDGTNTTFGTTTTGSNIVVNSTQGAECISTPFASGDWTFTTGWSISGATIVKVDNASTRTATYKGAQAIEVYHTYKVVITATEVTGAITWTLGGTSGVNLTATTQTENITTGTTAKLIFSGVTGTTCTITAISIIEQTQGTGDETNNRLITNTIWSKDNTIPSIYINKSGNIGLLGAPRTNAVYIAGSMAASGAIASSSSISASTSVTAGSSATAVNYLGSPILTTYAATGASLDIFPQDKDAPYIRFGAGNDNTTFTTEWGRFIVGGNLGLGITTPPSKLSLDGGNATAVYTQLTNGTTTGQTITDGSHFGSDASGNTTIIQKEANKYIDIMKNDTSVIRVAANRKVGIGTTAPYANLQVNGILSNPNLANDNAIFSVYGTASNNALEFGTLTAPPWTFWMQVRDVANHTAYPLSINPNGGKVGIGTTAPINNLTVVGGISADSIKVGNVHKNLVWDAKQAALTAKQIHDSLTVSATMKGSASTNGLRLNGSQKIVLDSANTTYGGAFTKFQYNKLQSLPTTILDGQTRGAQYNTFFGAGAGLSDQQTSNQRNTYIGLNAGRGIETGTNNTALGFSAGYGSSSVGNYNIMIGANAGSYTARSNRLIISSMTTHSEAEDSTEALIYGRMSSTVANQKVTVNGDLTYALRHCFLDHSADYTPAVTQNVYKKIQPTFTPVEVANMTFGGDTITITSPGDYMFIYNATIRGANNNDFTTSIRVNNQRVKDVRQTTTSATNYQTYTIMYYFEDLAVGDDISLWITNTTNSDDPTLSSQNIYMKKEHD
jgi:hypothetical protein